MRKKQLICAAMLAVVLLFSGCDSSGASQSGVFGGLSEKLLPQEISFQGDKLSKDTTELTVESLTMEEAEALASLPNLRTVQAGSCKDYPALAHLKQLRPEVQVNYHVPMGGKTFASTAVQLSLSDISPEEIGLLEYLPYVRTVIVSGGDVDTLEQLKSRCEETGIRFRVQIAGTTLSEDVAELTLPDIGNQDAALLCLASGVKKLHLVEPQADGQLLQQLVEALPETQVTWEKTVFGMTYHQDAEQIDLTEILALGPNQKLGDKTVYQRGLNHPMQPPENPDPSVEETRYAVKIFKDTSLPDKTAQTAELIAEAEAAMAYFPEAKDLLMCGCILDNEAMAAFREAKREDYKVIWSVDCGEIAIRTDSPYIMPVKYHVYYLNNNQAYNLRYCEEAVAVDIGHMNLSDLSFVEFMPNLQYLILAHTSVQHIEPLATCKNLKFLELDHTAVKDLTPLLGCTALEDLNIGNTWCPVDPLKEMTWLNNLWMIFRAKSAAELTEHLTETNIVYGGTATVDSGWRDLPNYFAMRDTLNMFYMGW